MPNKPESFEIAEYSPPELGINETFQIIKQITEEIIKVNPTVGVWVDMSGDMLRVHYHAYEIHLPSRVKDVQAVAEETMKKYVSHLKSEFKARTKKPLDIKEKKELANYTVEKVSLNERYYYRAWRFYELSV
jgi:hypothetical protein